LKRTCSLLQLQLLLNAFAFVESQGEDNLNGQSFFMKLHVYRNKHTLQ